MDGISNIYIDSRYIGKFDIDKTILKNIDIDKAILENIDKEILENIDIDKITNPLEFDISNRAMRWVFTGYNAD